MVLQARQSEQQSGADEFLDLISNPFQSEIQVNSIYASIIWSFAVSGGLFVLFVLLRPRNSNVYAPRAKHADERHAPAPLGKTPFAWTPAVRKIEEHELVEKIGLDAVVFLRFIRMLRNLFLIFAVLGCAVLIPLNLVGGHSLYDSWSNVATLMKFTPQYIFGQKFWGYVILAYVFQFILFFFIWWNYRAVLDLRRRYFESTDYRQSLHSRTLLVTHIPASQRSEEGIFEIAKQTGSSDNAPKTVIARNARELPELVEKHDEAVRQLESHLAKYLANPDQLPSTRPLCRVAKEDREEYSNAKVDAIEYLQQRIHRLRVEIEETRKSIDARDAMSYGFASYSNIEDAHAAAYSTRKKGPLGSTVRLAPKPHDLIWQNLPMSRSLRRTRMFWDGLWIFLLTLAYIPFNILSSVFLSDFSRLGLLWSDFDENLEAHPVGWGIAQGIIAPTFQYLIFLGLPTVFRRLYNHAGDTSKTSRERHVMARLYVFFVVNNLVVFSVFGTAFRFIAAVVQSQDENVWDSIRNAHVFVNLMAGLCNVSTFWLTYQMQQNLTAAIDLAQLKTLAIRWYLRKLTHPTPRELIELTAPPPFDYANYYNNYLFVATVGMCFGFLQPIIFPITAFYMFIEVMFKRYQLQYVAITKTESGGMFWRALINRLLFGNLIANAVVALVVGAQGIGTYSAIGDTAANGGMLYAMIGLPCLMWAFKWYCTKTFDAKMRYVSTDGSSDLENSDGQPLKQRRGDRVAVRFGHPALYKKLITPMVDSKAQHLVEQIISPELRKISSNRGANTSSVFGYSDLFIGEDANGDKKKPEDRPVHAHVEAPDRTSKPFEFVDEEDMDFENFKRRAEFRDQHGGDGELYGRPEDLISRSGTPSTMQTLTMDSPAVKRKAVGSGSWNIGSPSSSRVPSRQELRQVSDETYANADASTSLLHLGRERAGSVDVDIPAPKLDAEEILNAGSVGRR